MQRPPISFWVEVKQHDELARICSATVPYETGGVILGYRGRNESIVATHFIGPGPKARHEREEFWPDQKYHEEEVSRIYTSSSRQVSYMGDWHSHPKRAALPSALDVTTLNLISASKPARLPYPIMYILAPSEEGEWVGRAFTIEGSSSGNCSSGYREVRVMFY